MFATKNSVLLDYLNQGDTADLILRTQFGAANKGFQDCYGFVVIAISNILDIKLWNSCLE